MYAIRSYYAPFGESHYLQPGDRSVVLVYDGRRYGPEQIHQRVVARNNFV